MGRVAQRPEPPPKPPTEPKSPCDRAKLAEIQLGRGAAAPPGRFGCHGQARERVGELGAEGLVLGGGRDAAFDSEVVEERRHLRGAEGTGVATTVEGDEGAGPLDIGVLRARGVVQAPDGLANGGEERARADVRGRLGGRGEGHGPERSSSEERPELRE